MAFEIPILRLTRTAAVDLSANRYYAVKLNSDGNMVLAGAGESALGVLCDGPAIGRAGAVMCVGVGLAMFGGSVTAGQNLTPDAAGKLVAAGATDSVLGAALESGADGEVHSVLLVSRVATGANTNSVLSIPIKLKNVADGNVMANWNPGFGGLIKKVAFAVTDPVTTAAKAASLTLEIGGTVTTGGVVALTSANCPLTGSVVNGTAITAANAFAASDNITLVASGVTAFVEGEGVLLITLG